MADETGCHFILCIKEGRLNTAKIMYVHIYLQFLGRIVLTVGAVAGVVVDWVA